MFKMFKESPPGVSARIYLYMNSDIQNLIRATQPTGGMHIKFKITESTKSLYNFIF